MQHLTEQWTRTAARKRRTPPQHLYHFTSTMHLDAILRAGYLRLTESNISMTGAGPGVVWLTETTEGAGNGLGGAGFKDQVRFTIASSSLGRHLEWWPSWSREQGIEEFWYEALHRASGGGNPDNWWVVTKEIPLNVCEVEVREGSAWVLLEGA